MKHPAPLMKYLSRPDIASMITTAAIMIFSGVCNAAFIIEASDSLSRLGFGNFTYTGTGGTAASYNDATSGTLPAYADTPATFFSLRHAYGGNGSTDQYTFTYTPAVNPDNAGFAAGTLFNSLGAFGPPDSVSSGLTGGTAGIYNVYRIHPNTTNVNGGDTTYQVQVGATVQLTEVINQNYSLDLAAQGKNIGRWELIGSVSVPNATDTVTLTMTASSATFVSMRASGIMFEYVAPIPEPGSVALLCLGAMAFCGRHRR